MKPPENSGGMKSTRQLNKQSSSVVGASVGAWAGERLISSHPQLNIHTSKGAGMKLKDVYIEQS